ncbi:hypothetical protein D3C78_878490 [compost metagenome]
MTQARLDVVAFQGGQELGAGAENADGFLVDQVDQALWLRVEGRAVVQHDATADRQGRDQPVPHHPATGGVVEQPVVRAQVNVQAVFLDVLQQHAAGTVDDAFRHAGGAAGVEDVQRMGEGHRDELGLAAGLIKAVPQRNPGLGPVVFDACLWPGVRHDDQLLQRRQAFKDFVDLERLVDGLAGIAVTGAGDQYFRLDLAETVDHTLGAEVRRRTGPDRAQAGGGQHAYQGLPSVGHARRHPVTQADTGCLQALLQTGYMVGEVGITQLLALAIFAKGDHRHGAVATTQQVFGKVQCRVGKPLGIGHLRAFTQHRAGRLAEGDREEVDNGLPEIRTPVDAPLVQGRVVGEGQAVLLIAEAPKGIHAGLADTFGAGLPEYVGHDWPLVLMTAHALLSRIVLTLPRWNASADGERGNDRHGLYFTAPTSRHRYSMPRRAPGCRLRCTGIAPVPPTAGG